MVAGKDELTRLVIEIAGLRARAEILRLKDVQELLTMVHTALMLALREIGQAERDNSRGERDEEGG